MRTRWNPEEQVFELIKPSSRYKCGPRKHPAKKGRKTEEVYDYSDPDLTTLQETFYYQ